VLAVITLLQLITSSIILQESPKYLISKGSFMLARVVLRKIAAVNGKNIEIATFEQEGMFDPTKSKLRKVPISILMNDSETI
jgi:hypothetical protein